MLSYIDSILTARKLERGKYSTKQKVVGRERKSLLTPNWFSRLSSFISEFKQITKAAGATTAAVTEKVWVEYISVVRQMSIQMLAKQNTKMSETWAKEFKISFI